MPDYYTQGTLMPFIPEKDLTEKAKMLLDVFGFVQERIKPEEGGKTLYFYNPEYSGVAYDQESDVEIEEEDLFIALQEVVRKSDTLNHLRFEAANTCTRMTPDSQGGFAVLITEDEISYSSTASWLSEKIAKLPKKGGDKNAKES